MRHGGVGAPRGGGAGGAPRRGGPPPPPPPSPFGKGTRQGPSTVGPAPRRGASRSSQGPGMRHTRRGRPVCLPW
ncbi:MAG: hypothetical protein F4X65_03210 [Chloroflexi bacterium]|nr:hypothetical protein [Chloroflexota bacterium]